MPGYSMADTLFVYWFGISPAFSHPGLGNKKNYKISLGQPVEEW